jgi:hypothetical protein
MLFCKLLALFSRHSTPVLHASDAQQISITAAGAGPHLSVLCSWLLHQQVIMVLQKRARKDMTAAASPQMLMLGESLLLLSLRMRTPSLLRQE